jgi:hypothetical protein
MEEKESKEIEKVSTKGLRIFISIQLLLLFITIIFLLQNGEYGWSLFMTLPLSIGLTIGYHTRISKSISWLKLSFKVFFIIVAISAALIAIGLEGAICVLMALGLIVLPALLGLLFGYLIRKIYVIQFFFLVVIFNSGFIIYDVYEKEGFEEEAAYSVEINLPLLQVNNILQQKFEFSEHPNIFFKNGISYPNTMQLQKLDRKLCLICTLNKEEVVLPILELNDTIMRFTVEDDFIAMKETNPFYEVHTKHQQGYFKVVFGEFKLKEISKNKTRIIATTRYQYKITPRFYWRWWTNYIVQEMHEHVLSDIKRNAETRGK